METNTNFYKGEFIMLNFILLMVVIYVALVGASLTMVMLVCSKWYVNKVADMSKEITKSFFDEED